MRNGFIALLIGVLLLGATLAPKPAHALSCMGVEEQLDDYALVALGRITSARPLGRATPGGTPPVTVEGMHLRLLGVTPFRKSAVTMEVERYLKGEGPHTLDFVYTWSQYRRVTDEGLHVYVGLRYSPEEQQYTASECSLLASPTTRDEYGRHIIALLHDTYGEGRPPGAPLRHQWLLPGAVGTAAVTVAAAYTRRRGTHTRRV